MKNLITRLLLSSAVLATMCISPALSQRYTWIDTLTGPSFDETTSLAVAPNSDVHVVGVFSDSLSVGGMDIKAVGNYDIFTGRFNSKGQAINAAAHGSFDVDESGNIVVDGEGNYYFGGAFLDQAVVAGELVEGIDATSMDMFVAKLNKFGIVQWIKVCGSPTYDEGAPFLAVDSTGNVYVAGGVGGTGQFGTKTYKSVGKLDAFVAKMNSAGEFLWVVGAGSSDNDMAKGVAVSANGDRVYSYGTFIGQVSFGNATFDSYAGKADFFVRAVNATGQPLWTQRLGWSGIDDVIAGHAMPDGRLVLTGSMNQTMYFGTQTLKANGEFGSDLFITRMAKDGSFELLKNYGGTFNDVGTAIYADAKGNMFVGGSFDSTTVIGSFAEDSYGGDDGIILRVLPNGEVDWMRAFGGPYDDEARGIAVDGKNVPYVTGVFDTYMYVDGEKINGDRFTDAFVAALECGPSTLMRPRTNTLKICEGQDTTFEVRFGYPMYEWYLNGEKLALTSYRFNTAALKQGTYKVYCRIKGFDECIKNTDTVTITVTPGLQMPMIVRNADELTCSVDLVNYQWYREGQPIKGATSRSVKIVGDGFYRVLISDTAGCKRWSDNFLVGTTDVVDLIDGSSISVYPNPTTGSITLQGASGAEIICTDMLGRVVARIASATDMQPLAIEGVSGVYSLSINTGNTRHTLLVTKQ
ncbi:MAG: T9SS type A sorting domain-containing protein [Ignavibacteria bacterium]|jgi:hypothetical protein